jgi:hypothetical protein
VSAAGICALAATVTPSGQGLRTFERGSPTKNWVPPRLPDGRPDLQGVWRNNNVTPLQRPVALAQQSVLTEEQVARIRQRAAELFSGDGDPAYGDTYFNTLLSDAKTHTPLDNTGDHNQFWLSDRDLNDSRTALIIDPPDGRLPPLTGEEQERRNTRRASGPDPRSAASGPEDRQLNERCITFGVPDLLPAYMSYYQIFQTRDYIAILHEKIHDVRIIPLESGRPANPRIRQWLGVRQGHWEGDTLVVESTNFPASSLLFAGNTDENLHLVERFTRVSPTVLNYEFTITDPTVWTRPWTAMIPLRAADSSERIYEYACHEGNRSMVSVLAGARAAEKAAPRVSGR